MTLEEEVKILRSENIRQRERIEDLELKLDQVLRLFRSSKSEKLDANQLSLLDDDALKKLQASSSDETTDLEEVNENDAKNRSKPISRKKRVDGLDQLEVIEVIHEPDELEIEGKESFEKIGEEVTNRLEIIPRKIFIKRHIRPKYRRKTAPNQAPVVATAPPSVLIGGLPGASILAHLLVGKYCDHLPLYRQSAIFSRSKVYIPRDLLLKWTHRSIRALQPIANAIRDETLGRKYLQVDETKIRYLQPESPSKGKAPFGYLWLANDPHGSLYYHWGIGRGEAQLIETIGQDFEGTLQCDGWSAYLAYARHHPEVHFMSCLAHIRRGFFDYYESVKKEPSKAATKQSRQILSLVGQLYRIEAKLRRQKAGPALRDALRSSQSRPIVKRLEAIFKILMGKYRPSHPLGQALMYALGQWDRFKTYLDDGLIEIDNNLVENAVRPTKLGMKNWLFFGSKDAGHQAAIIYTIIENCRRYQVPVEDYLREVFEIIPTLNDLGKEAADLTPAKIAEARKRGAQKSAA